MTPRQVDAIMELTTSSVALAVQGISKEKKKIDIVTGAATTDLTGKPARPTASTGPTTPMRWPSAPAARWSSRAATAGSSSPPTMPSATRWRSRPANYVKANGGKVVGAVRHPLATPDFSPSCCRRSRSGAKVIGLANAGLDTANAIKQAAEFGIVARAASSLAALLFTLAEVHGLGLEAAQGLTLTEGFYWDRDDKTREFAKKFFERTGRMPNMIQAGTYSAVMQYLKAIKTGGHRRDGGGRQASCTRCRSTTSSARGGKVGANGRMIHDMYLLEVKKPEESKEPWDYFKVLATIPATKAYIDPAKSGCPIW